MEKLLQQILDFLKQIFSRRKYTIVTLQISKPGTINTLGCNAVVFVNRHANNAIVNDEIIEQNQSIVNSGLEGEMDETQYKIEFPTNNTGLVICRYKKYST